MIKIFYYWCGGNLNCANMPLYNKIEVDLKLKKTQTFMKLQNPHIPQIQVCRFE